MSSKWCKPGQHVYWDSGNKLEGICKECKKLEEFRSKLVTGERKCLMCLNYFHSKHKGNRICGRCKKTETYVNSTEEYNVSKVSKLSKGPGS